MQGSSGAHSPMPTPIHAPRAEEEGRPSPDDDVDDEFDDDFDAIKGMGRLFCEVGLFSPLSVEVSKGRQGVGRTQRKHPPTPPTTHAPHTPPQVGEAYLPLILTATPEVAAPVEALLEVAAHPDADIHSMAFGFWYKLSKQLRGREGGGGASRSGSMASSASTANMAEAGAGGGGGPNGELPGPPPGGPEGGAAEAERQRAFFAPAFEKLLATARARMRCAGLVLVVVVWCVCGGGRAVAPHSALVRRHPPAQRPSLTPHPTPLHPPPRHSAPDALAELSSSARADWKRTRAAWGDVLIDAALALRGPRALTLLLAPLHDVARAAGGGGAFDWQTAELALHCVR